MKAGTSAAALAFALLLLASCGVAAGFGGVGFNANETTVHNPNPDEPPAGCSEVEGEDSVTVVVEATGEDHPVYSYDPSVVEVEPCTALEVVANNRDDVRHQLIVRGLPEDTYPGGYFGFELDENELEAATFVTPPEDVALEYTSTIGDHRLLGLQGWMVVGDAEVPESTPRPPTEDDAGVSAPAYGAVGLVFGCLSAFTVGRLRRR